MEGLKSLAAFENRCRDALAEVMDFVKFSALCLPRVRVRVRATSLYALRLHAWKP